KVKFRRLAVRDRDDGDSADPCNRDRFGEGAVALSLDEAPGVQVDEHTVAVLGRDAAPGSDDARAHTADHARLDVHRPEHLGARDERGVLALVVLAPRAEVRRWAGWLGLREQRDEFRARL